MNSRASLLRFRLLGNGAMVVGKRILLDALGDRLPPALLTRPKMGFGVPLDRLVPWAVARIDVGYVDRTGASRRAA